MGFELETPLGNVPNGCCPKGIVHTKTWAKLVLYCIIQSMCLTLIESLNFQVSAKSGEMSGVCFELETPLGSVPNGCPKGIVQTKTWAKLVLYCIIQSMCFTHTESLNLRG